METIIYTNNKRESSNYSSDRMYDSAYVEYLLMESIFPNSSSTK